MIAAGYSVVAWTFLLIFFAATIFWLAEILIIGQARQQPGEHPPTEVQARIMTIDSQEVVQATVSSLPDELTDVRVIAEKEIAVNGATVHVVLRSLPVKRGGKHERSSGHDETSIPTRNIFSISTKTLSPRPSRRSLTPTSFN